MTQKQLSQLLRLLIVISTAAGLILCAGAARFGYRWCAFNGVPQLYPLGLVVLCLAVAGVLAAVVLAWRIFTSIGQDRSFTFSNSRRLKSVGWLFLGVALLFLLALPLFAALAPLGAVGMALLLAVSFVALAVAVISFCLAHLVYKAAELKAEQELTV